MEQTNFTQTKLNTVDDVLRPRFKLTTIDRDIYEPIPNKKLWFKSKKINIGETTMKDIYKYCKRELRNFQREYKQGYIDEDIPVSISTYDVKVIGEYMEEIDDVMVVNIYHVELYGVDEITREHKYYVPENKTIQAPFNVYIIITLYNCPEPEPEPLTHLPTPEPLIEDLNPLEPLSLSTLLSIQRSIKQEECVICYETQPNVLYQDCKHISTCSECENAGRILRCPICRAEVRKGKIKI